MPKDVEVDDKVYSYDSGILDKYYPVNEYNTDNVGEMRASQQGQAMAQSQVIIIQTKLKAQAMMRLGKKNLGVTAQQAPDALDKADKETIIQCKARRNKYQLTS